MVGEVTKGTRDGVGLRGISRRCIPRIFLLANPSFIYSIHKSNVLLIFMQL